jgi:hypothetical protein
MGFIYLTADSFREQLRRLEESQKTASARETATIITK